MIKTLYKDVICKVASDLTSHQKRLNKIIDSINKNTILEINYLDKKGNKTKRKVEPYKLTGDDFWGYDITKNSIRRFKTSNIKGIKEYKTQYEPRWQTEIIN